MIPRFTAVINGLRDRSHGHITESRAFPMLPDGRNPAVTHGHAVTDGDTHCHHGIAFR